MTPDVPTVTPNISISDFVENYLMSYHFTCYPVVENGQVKGIVGIDDIRTVPRDRWSIATVGEVTEQINESMKVTKDDDVWVALQKLNNNPCQRLLVMHDGQLDGTVTQDSIFRLVRLKLQLGR